MAVILNEDDKWPVPEIVSDYMFCMMYQCLPDELDRQDALRVEKHWFVHGEIKRLTAEKEALKSGKKPMNAQAQPSDLDEFYPKEREKKPTDRSKKKRVLE